MGRIFNISRDSGLPSRRSTAPKVPHDERVLTMCKRCKFKTLDVGHPLRCQKCGNLSEVVKT